MKQHNLPLYAIVELLMRIALYNKSIGSYKDHSDEGDNVRVTTTAGYISFSTNLIAKQFLTPEEVTNSELSNAIATFVHHDALLSAVV